jgi:hypothetical protein
VRWTPQHIVHALPRYVEARDVQRRYALDHPAVGRVMAIGRRKLGIAHSKLDEVLHQDFADCSALAETLSGQDAAIFCLGTYTGSVSNAEHLDSCRGDREALHALI